MLSDRCPRVFFAGRCLPVVLVTVCCLHYSAAAQFEGLVESKNRTTDETGILHEFDMKMWIKGEMVRIEISEIGDSPGSTVIYRSDIGLLWILNDRDSTFFEVKKVVGVRDSVPRFSDGSDPVLEKTGKKKSILGYRSEQFIVRSGETQTEIWGTKELDRLADAIARGLGEDVLGSGSWNDELTRSGIFPLTAVTRAGSGVWESSEVTSLREECLPESRFRVPSYYQKQSVEQYFMSE